MAGIEALRQLQPEDILKGRNTIAPVISAAEYKVKKEKKKSQIILPPLSSISSEQLDGEETEGDNTSIHELKHAAAVIGLGKSLRKISVVPEGISLGRTEFDGFMSEAEFGIVAAASAVSSKGYKPQGYGMDKLMAESRNVFWDAAVIEAGRIVSRYSDDEYLIASKILKIKGEVDGGMFHQIMARAKFEIARRNNALNEYEQEHEEDRVKQESHERSDQYTSIENYGNGNFGMKYYDKGKVINEIKFTVCSACKELNGHKIYCKLKKDETVDKNNSHGKEDQKNVEITNSNSTTENQVPLQETFGEREETSIDNGQNLEKIIPYDRVIDIASK